MLSEGRPLRCSRLVPKVERDWLLLLLLLLLLLSGALWR
jgi:hypothetical protein